MNREELIKTAQARLYPSLTNPNYLVLRARREILAPYFQRLPDNLSVLDVGGRYQPYRPLLLRKVKKYLALDVDRTEFVSVVGSGQHLPFLGEAFDLVIATGVFEYFEDPQQAARDLLRILKPGGSLIASVGAVVPRFVDQERWRYLPLGLKTIFCEFSQLTIVPEVSSLGGFCRLINLGFHDFLKLSPLKSAYRISVCPVLNLLGFWLEHAHLTSNDKWTGNYTIIALK
jgi:SAM-dependent methyltransferase